MLKNKKDIIDFVRHQLNIDLSPYLDEAAARSRTYLGVHLEKMCRSDRDKVMQLLRYKHGLRIEYNGGFGYALYYNKTK